MTVYIEYVLLDNFVIDYLLLKTAHKIAGVTAREGRLLLCSAAGAIIALAYPLINVKAITVAVKILCGFLIAASSAKYRSAREFLLTLISFVGLTFLTGGTIVGVFELLGLAYSSEISVALMILPAYVVISCAAKTIKTIYKRKDVAAFIYKVVLKRGENEITAAGFMDTGNCVYDGDSPVVFVNSSVAKRLIFDKSGKPVNLKKLTVHTVNGTEEKICFKLDGLTIYIGGATNIITNVTACVADKGGDIGYDVLLHPALLAVNIAA